MDPNKALSNMLAREADIRVMVDLDLTEYEGITFREAAEDLADAVECLNDWLAKGGFLPEAWAR